MHSRDPCPAPAIIGGATVDRDGMMTVDNSV